MKYIIYNMKNRENVNPEEEEAYREMGRQNEILFKPFIEGCFGKINHTENWNDVIDFYGDGFMVELKSRTNNYNDFKDTMIGNNKIETGFKKLNENENYRVFYAFAFKDGLYFWELNKNTYEENGGKSRVKIGGTNDRGYDDYKYHYYIDVVRLNLITDKGCWIHPYIQRKIDNKNKDKLKTGVCYLKIKRT